MGDHLRGTITLTLTQPIDLYSLVVSVQGKDESLKIFSSEENEQDFIKRRVFYMDSETLHDFAGKSVQSGTYQFPFALKLPLGLPPSVSYTRNGSEFFTRIRYFVKAQVHAADPDFIADECGKSSIRAKQFVTVSVPQLAPVASSSPVVLPINKLVGVLNTPCSGSITLEKAHFHPGETVHLKIDLDNSLVEEGCKLEVIYTCSAKIFHDAFHSHTERLFDLEIADPHIAGPEQVVKTEISFSLPKERHEKIGGLPH